MVASSSQSPSCAALERGSVERAACHARQRQWPEAEENYRLFLQEHPESLPAALGRIQVLLRMSQRQAESAVTASQELKKLLESHPDDPGLLKAQAGFEGNVQKNLGAAEATLKRLTTVAPGDAEGWGLLGSLYLDSRQPDKAIPCFERAAALDAVNPLYKAGLARCLAATGRDSEADKAFAASIAAAKPGTNPLVFVWYGDFLASAERYQDSLAAYSRVTAADPGDADAWLKRASVEAKAGRYREAERDAQEALRQGAPERETQNLLVHVYQGLGDDGRMRAAAAAVERAANAEERRREAWRRAKESLDDAERLMRSGRFSEALPLYARVNADVPSFADAWFAAGICYVQTGDPKRSEEAFRTFLRLQPLSADGHSALGILLLGQKRTDEARSELQEALRLDPASVEAIEALASINAAAR